LRAARHRCEQSWRAWHVARVRRGCRQDNILFERPPADPCQLPPAMHWGGEACASAPNALPHSLRAPGVRRMFTQCNPGTLCVTWHAPPRAGRGARPCAPPRPRARRPAPPPARPRRAPCRTRAPPRAPPPPRPPPAPCLPVREHAWAQAPCTICAVHHSRCQHAIPLAVRHRHSLDHTQRRSVLRLCNPRLTARIGAGTLHRACRRRRAPPRSGKCIRRRPVYCML